MLLQCFGLMLGFQIWAKFICINVFVCEILLLLKKLSGEGITFNYADVCRNVSTFVL